MIGSTKLVSAVVLAIFFCGIANAQGNHRVPLRRQPSMLQSSVQFINPEMPEGVYAQVLSANTGFGGVTPVRRFNSAPGTVILANGELPNAPDQQFITSNGRIFTMEAPDVPTFGSAFGSFVSPFSEIGALPLNGIGALPLNGLNGIGALPLNGIGALPLNRIVASPLNGLNRNVVTTRNGPVIIDSADLGHGLRRY